MRSNRAGAENETLRAHVGSSPSFFSSLFFPSFTGNSVKHKARRGRDSSLSALQEVPWRRGLFYMRISVHIAVIRQRYGALIDHLVFDAF